MFVHGLVGLDEVGRGCWAGPLVAGAVILSKPITGLKDSKKLTKLQREKLAIIINKEALAIGLGWVWPEAIDSGGITEAVKNAMQTALQQIKLPYQKVIIDGDFNFLPDISVAETLIKADDTVPCVSAASIIAKVARDQYMANMALEFPEYGFEKHVGYGTALHLEMLKLHGVTSLHRKSYKPIQSLIGASV